MGPTAESILELKNKARLNLVAFRHLILQKGDNEQDVEPAPFHYEWSEAILNGKGHEVWECFRESAKSQLILRSFPLYQVAFPEERFNYMVLIKNNATLASSKLKEIAQEYITNAIASANKIDILEQSGNVFHVKSMDTKGEIIETRIEAYGKGSSVRGAAYQDKRPKIAVIDDPQDTEDAKSDVVLDADWNWFLSDVLFLGKTTRIFLIGNNLGDKCIVEKTMANAHMFNFTTHRIPIEKEGVATWPAKFPMEFILKEKEAYKTVGKLDIWLRERMCQSTSEETRTFNFAKDFPLFDYREIPKLMMTSNLAGTLDPAASSNPGSCYRAICVNGVTIEGYWMVLDILYGRWDSPQLIDKIFYAVSKYNLKRFGVEKGMLFDFMEPFIRTRMAKDQIFFELIPLEHAKKGTKIERIKMLAPRAKTRSIWLPNYAQGLDGLAPWTTELELEIQGVTRDALKSEYVDLLDALAMQDQIAIKPSEYGNQQTPGTAGMNRNRPPLQTSYDNTPRLG